MWLISIIAMLCWSGSDIFSKAGSHQSDKKSHLKVGIAVGTVMGLHALYEIFVNGVPISFSDIILYLPASFLYISSMIIGYIGLRYIELSISSPICNCSGAFALLMSLMYFGVNWNGMLSNEDAVFLNTPIVTGVILIILGIVALGIVEYTEDDEARLLRQTNRKYHKSFIAILLPILYCLIDSLGTFVDTVIADKYILRLLEQGVNPNMVEDLCGSTLNVAYELTWFVMAIIFAIYIFGIKREKVSKKYDGLKTLGAICETAGQFFYMMVVVSNYKVGLVIISSYCAVSLLWSRLFLKEKLSLKHYIAIFTAFIGIVILGIYDV